MRRYVLRRTANIVVVLLGMTLFVFEDAQGWTASISRPISEGDNFYRTRTLDLVAIMRSTYDLNAPRLSGSDEIW